MAIKQRPDSPTNNFATLNPLVNDLGGTSVTFSEGNLKYDASQNPEAHINFNADSYFFEFYDNNASVNATLIIAGAEDGLVGSVDYPSVTNHSRIYYNGVIDNRGSANLTVNSGSLFNIPYSTVISVYKENKNTLILNSVATNDAVEINVSGLGEDFVIFFANYTSSKTANYIVNFGQDPTFGGNKNTPATVNGVTGPFAPSGDAAGTAGLFFYPPPAGAKALCTANLPEMTPTVNDDVPKDYFKALTYTGTYPTANSVNVGFNPDLIWLKSRTQQYNHGVWDTIRTTVNGYEFLSTDNTNAEATSGNAISFITNGFSVNIGQAFNEGGQGDDNIVAWCWKAGGAPQADNSNTSGAMTPYSVSLNGTLQSNYTPAGSPTVYPKRMSINTDAGFSIVKYTGNSSAATNSGSPVDFIPHGLNSPPEFFILKDTSRAGSWNVGISNIIDTNDRYLRLNESTNVYTNIIIRADSNVIQLDHYNVENTVEYICYAWHSVEGFSKFGSYIGNGSPNGPFVYCGFRPAFLMVKCIESSAATNHWAILDNARDPFNIVSRKLNPNDYYIENSDPSSWGCDFLSTGVKIRNNWGASNEANKTYIFMAFAEQPFNYATAR